MKVAGPPVSSHASFSLDLCCNDRQTWILCCHSCLYLCMRVQAPVRASLCGAEREMCARAHLHLVNHKIRTLTLLLNWCHFRIFFFIKNLSKGYKI
jgi:hypothetical protein